MADRHEAHAQRGEEHREEDGTRESEDRRPRQKIDHVDPGHHQKDEAFHQRHQRDHRDRQRPGRGGTGLGGIHLHAFSFSHTAGTGAVRQDP